MCLLQKYEKNVDPTCYKKWKIPKLSLLQKYKTNPNNPLF